MIGLLGLAGALAWWLLAPYDPDARAATYQVGSVRVTRDYQFRWLDIELDARVASASQPPAALTGASGWRLAPAAASWHGNRLTLRFWLEEAQLAEALELTVDTSHLRIKPGGHAPELANGESRRFRTLTSW